MLSNNLPAMRSNSEISKYYDEYSTKLSSIGFNKRHASIFKWLLRFGLSPDHRVLEIGCGPGTSTMMFTAFLRGGSVDAFDISEENIRKAKELHSGKANVQLSVDDAVKFKRNEKFDFIVMPDVIEHIPVEYHREMFRNIRQHLADDGKVIIHIPDPQYLEYNRNFHPEKLQIVDQSLWTEILSDNIKGSGLRITYLESYDLSQKSYDYQIVRLEAMDVPKDFSDKPWDMSLKARLIRKWRKLKGLPIYE